MLKAFRSGNPHFGIVADERGTEIGFVTFEHVIEASFEPIEDEFAKKTPSWQQAGDGSVSGAGSLSLLSLEDAIGKPIPVVDVNSVGGLVQEKLGRLPRQGEKVRFPDFEIEVLEMVGPRIAGSRKAARIGDLGRRVALELGRGAGSKAPLAHATAGIAQARSGTSQRSLPCSGSPANVPRSTGSRVHG